MRQIGVFLLLLGCIFSMPSLNGNSFAMEIPATVNHGSGIPDGQEDSHESKEMPTHNTSTNIRQHPRHLELAGLTEPGHRCSIAISKTLRPAIAPARPFYYAFLSRYTLF